MWIHCPPGSRTWFSNTSSTKLRCPAFTSCNNLNPGNTQNLGFLIPPSSRAILSAPKFLPRLQAKFSLRKNPNQDENPTPKLLSFGASQDLDEGESHPWAQTGNRGGIPDFATGFWDSQDSHSRQKSPTHVFSGQMNQSPAQVHPAEGRKLSLGSLIRPVTSEYLG